MRSARGSRVTGRGESIERVFLGWDHPALDAARDVLIQRFCPGAELDLHEVLVVVPGRRSARNLLASLVEASHDRGTPLWPPTLITPGEIVESILGATGRPAGPITRRLCWIGALVRAGTETIAALTRPFNEDDDLLSWSALAQRLEGWAQDLSGQMLRFSDLPRAVVESGVGEPEEPERRRWAAADRVQQIYLELLGERGLVDPDWERLGALGDVEPRWDGPIVLVGVADVNRAARHALLRVGDRVTSLIPAPDERGEDFDEIGCPIPERWAAAMIDLDDSDLLCADGPGDQAQRVVEAVADFDGRFSSSQITIGLGDASLTPFIERTFRVRVGVPAHPPTGDALIATAPVRLLGLVADLSETGSYSAYSALVRHPDFEDALLAHAQDLLPDRIGDDWLDLLDGCQASSLRDRVDGDWIGAWAEDRPVLSAILESCRYLLGDLWSADPEPPARYPGDWAPLIFDMLGRVYAGRGAETLCQRTIESCQRLESALGELDRSRSTGGKTNLSSTASETIRLLVDMVADETLAPEAAPSGIEMVGWLELLLDPAPALVVAGVNEGFVPPGRRWSDLLLPGHSEALGLDHERRLAARDAFVLASLAASRDRLVLISGRRDAEGSPQYMSPLLLRCDDATAARRVRRLVDGRDAGPRIRVEPLSLPAQRSAFRPMPVVQAPPVTSMRVTAFGTYLQSPYLFYLVHVLGLVEAPDEAIEMDPLQFGSLLHAVLDRFARSDTRGSTDEDQIRDSLLDAMDSLAGERFGPEPTAPVWLQLRAARDRLRGVAHWQAEWARAGWRIHESEWSPDAGTASLDVDGRPMNLRGRIDRIDVNEQTGQWAILDYKTGEQEADPNKAHRTKEAWTDLQLPLYRHLIEQLDAPEDIVLGYVTIPKDPGKVGLRPASWDPDDLRDADEAAREVVRAIRAERFEDPGSDPPDEGVFSAILGRTPRTSPTSGESEDEL